MSYRRGKTNGEFYGDSYMEAAAAFDSWCERELSRGSRMCATDSSCEVCQARWFALPFDREEYERLVEEARKEGIESVPGNEEADRMLVEAGMLEKAARFERKGRTVRWSRNRTCWGH